MEPTMADPEVEDGGIGVSGAGVAPAAEASARPEPGPPLIEFPNRLLALVLVVGGVLRLFQLGRESLWVDEGFTAKLVGLDAAQYVDNVRHTVRNILPPGYFVGLRSWTRVFGMSEVSLRMPSVLFGLAAIALLYYVANRLFGHRVAIVTASLLAISPFHVAYSQEARMYELLALLSLGSIALLVGLIEGGGFWFGMALATVNAAMVYTHHYALFFVGAEWVAVALVYWSASTTRSVWREWLFSNAVFAIVVLPWLFLFLNQFAKVAENPWLPPPGWRSIWHLVSSYSGSAYAAPAFLLLAGLAFARYAAWPRALFRRSGMQVSDVRFLVMAVMLVVPVTAAFIFSVVVAPVFGDKYLIGASIPFFVIVAIGLESAWARQTVIAFAVLVIVTAGIPLYRAYTTIGKEQWREVAAYVDTTAVPESLVLFNAGFGLDNGFAYYNGRSDLVTRPFPASTEEVNTVVTAKEVARLDDLVNGHDEVWIVLSHSRDTSGLIAQRLKTMYGSEDCRDFVGIRTCRFRDPVGAG